MAPDRSDRRSPRRSLGLALVALVAPGCLGHSQLQYDVGRAYEAAFAAQANLGRPSAADAAYGLSGEEGLELRARVTETATDTESGEAEAIKRIAVQ